MEKVIRGGKVAVLYSSDYGAGWSSWNSGDTRFLFHPKLVEMVESGGQPQITEEFVRDLLGIPEDTYVCVMGACNLEIKWLPEGTSFEIQEYDGYESVRIMYGEYLVA